MTDFFISYTKVDQHWAEWVSWVLEEEGYSVVVQAWDFRPGTNFVVAMDEAAKNSQRTIAILSPAYCASIYGKTEWAAVLAEDPIGLQRKLVPVRVLDCKPEGLLRAIAWIDFVGLDEHQARAQLLDGVRAQRMKPEKPPLFPGARPHHAAPQHPAFPGVGAHAGAPGPFIPKLPTRTTELDIRRFMQSSFEEIRRHFEDGLAALKRSNSRFDTEFNPIDTTRFLAEVYVDGKAHSNASVRLGALHGSSLQILYSEGSGLSITQGNAFNEMLTAWTNAEGIHLKATMGALAMGSVTQHLDLEHLTQTHAADYLWRRFLQKLEHASPRDAAPLPIAADAPRARRPETARIERWKKYSREQIPPFFGLEFTEALWNVGFVPFAEHQQVFLLATLEKRAMAENHQYKDHFLSPTQFQWQSQNRTAQDSKHGRLLHGHVAQGTHVHLFVRAEKKLRTGGGAPFIYCGPVRFESWRGEQPITVVWTLDEPVPANLREELRVPTGR